MERSERPPVAAAAHRPGGGLSADTSVFVAAQQRRAPGEPYAGEARICVATLTELIVAARRAGRGRLRTLREQTLARARKFIALPLDEPVAARLGKLLAAARSAGHGAGAMDAIIAATALAHDLAVWTQDDDFDALAELMPGLRVHRG